MNEVTISQTFSPEDLLALDYFAQKHRDQPSVLAHLPHLLQHWKKDYRLESWLYTARQVHEFREDRLLEPLSQALEYFMSLGVRPLWVEDFLFVIRTLLRHTETPDFSEILTDFLKVLQRYGLEICNQVINLGFSFATHVHTQFIQNERPIVYLFESSVRHHLDKLKDASPTEVLRHYQNLKVRWDQFEVSSV